MTSVPDTDTNEPCACDNPREFRLRWLLVNGIVVRCASCGGIYHQIERPEVLGPFIEELPVSGSGEVTLTLDNSVLEHGNK